MNAVACSSADAFTLACPPQQILTHVIDRRTNGEVIRPRSHGGDKRAEFIRRSFREARRDGGTSAYNPDHRGFAAPAEQLPRHGFEGAGADASHGRADAP